MIDESEGATLGTTYNPRRGKRVIDYTERFLDEMTALETGSFSDVTQFSLKPVGDAQQLRATLTNGSEVGLADPTKFVGFTQNDGELKAILLRNHGASHRDSY